MLYVRSATSWIVTLAGSTCCDNREAAVAPAEPASCRSGGESPIIEGCSRAFTSSDDQNNLFAGSHREVSNRLGSEKQRRMGGCARFGKGLLVAVYIGLVIQAGLRNTNDETGAAITVRKLTRLMNLSSLLLTRHSRILVTPLNLDKPQRQQPGREL